LDPVDKKVKEDVANALFELMEGYIKVKEEVKPTEKSKDETGINSRIELFSKHQQKKYAHIKVYTPKLTRLCTRSERFPRVQAFNHHLKRKSSHNGDSTESGSEEEDMEILAGVAVTSDDLYTTNKMRKTKRKT